MNTVRKNLFLIVWLILFSVCYILLKVFFGILTTDDAFITLSHARTLVEQGRCVMSLNNPVAATSTPLFTLILAAGARIFGVEALELISYGVSAVCEIASLCLVFLISRAIGISVPFAAATVSACGMSLGFYAAGASGMETMLYIFLILSGLYSIMGGKKRWSIALAVSFCAVLTRPEGILVPCALVLSTMAARENRRQCVAVCGISIAGLITFFTFYYLSYGNIVPHSVVVKHMKLDFGIQNAFTAWIEHAFYKGPVFGGRRVILIVNLVFMLAGLRGLLQKSSLHACKPIVSWMAVYILFFVVTRSSDPLSPWYFFPVVPCAIILISAGLLYFVKQRNYHADFIWALNYLFILYCFISIITEQFPQKYQLTHQDREFRYKKAAEWILKESGTSDMILIDEVGAIGYFSRLKILDANGLLSPETVPYIKHMLEQKQGYIKYLIALAEVFRPEWIITPRPTACHPATLNTEERILFRNYKVSYVLFPYYSIPLLEIWKRTEPKHYEKRCAAQTAPVIPASGRNYILNRVRPKPLNNDCLIIDTLGTQKSRSGEWLTLRVRRI